MSNDVYWMEVGALLNGLKWKTYVTKGDTVTGFRIRCEFFHDTSDMLHTLLNKDNKTSYSSRKDIEKILIWIKKTCDSLDCWHLLGDFEGYQNAIWYVANPMPSDWEEFLLWTEKYENNIL
tara:strand:- start:681 stop:1043 length:363 start_codon:yes stop_codon:yes gene_type:complete